MWELSVVQNAVSKFGGGGVGERGCNPKKTEKKTVPNLKSVMAFGFFSGFCGTFSVFRSELRQEIPAIHKSCQQ